MMIQITFADKPKRSVYLEKYKPIQKFGKRFICGYEVTRHGEPKFHEGREIIRMIEIHEGVTIKKWKRKTL